MSSTKVSGNRRSTTALTLLLPLACAAALNEPARAAAPTAPATGTPIEDKAYGSLVKVERPGEIGNSYCLRGSLKREIGHLREANSLMVWYNDGTQPGVVQIDKSYHGSATTCNKPPAGDADVIVRKDDRIKISPGTISRYVFTLLHKKAIPGCAPINVQTVDCYTEAFAALPMQLGMVNDHWLYLTAHLPGDGKHRGYDYYVMLADDGHGSPQKPNTTPIDKYYWVEQFPDAASSVGEPASCADERPSAATLAEWIDPVDPVCGPHGSNMETSSGGGGQHGPGWP